MTTPRACKRKASRSSASPQPPPGSTVDTTGDGVADTRGVPREALSVAIAKYHSYLKEKTLIDKIFDEFDKDKASARARRPRQ